MGGGGLRIFVYYHLVSVYSYGFKATKLCFRFYDTSLGVHMVDRIPRKPLLGWDTAFHHQVPLWINEIVTELRLGSRSFFQRLLMSWETNFVISLFLCNLGIYNNCRDTHLQLQCFAVVLPGSSTLWLVKVLSKVYWIVPSIMLDRAAG